MKRAKIYLEAYSNSGKYSAQAARNYCQEVASGRGILQKLGTMQIDVLDSVDPSIKEAKELKEVLNFIYSRFASSQNDCSHVLNNYQALSFSVAGIDHAEYLFDKILRGDRIAVEDFQRVVTGKTRIVFLKGYQDKSGGTGKNMYSPMSGRQCLLMVGSPDNNLAAGTDLVITRQNNNPPANSPSDTIRYGLFIGGEDKDIGAGILCVKGVSVDEVQLMLNRLGIELRDLE